MTSHMLRLGAAAQGQKTNMKKENLLRPEIRYPLFQPFPCCCPHLHLFVLPLFPTDQMQTLDQSRYPPFFPPWNLSIIAGTFIMCGLVPL